MSWHDDCRVAVVVGYEGASALHNAACGSVVHSQLDLGQGPEVLRELVLHVTHTLHMQASDGHTCILGLLG